MTLKQSPSQPEEARAAIRARAVELANALDADAQFFRTAAPLTRRMGKPEWADRYDIMAQDARLAAAMLREHERELLAVQAEATAALEAEYAADPAEQRAERYALEAADLTRRLMDMEAKVAEATAAERQRCAAKDAELANLVKLEALYRQNERAALHRLSQALTGGNAATWDEVFAAAEAIEEGAEGR